MAYDRVRSGIGTARRVRPLLLAVLVASLSAAAVAALPRAAAAGSPASQRAPSQRAATRTVSDVIGRPVPFGAARYHGAPGPERLRKRIVALASTPDGGGYWLLGDRGAVYREGDAHSYGSAADRHLRDAVVALVPSPDGKGYWIAASDGAVYGYGDAHFHGSALGRHPRVHVVSMAATPDGGGYWLADSDGAVYRFGDATVGGSVRGKRPRSPVVAIVATPDGRGFWLAAANGKVFPFGDARSHGSAFGKHPHPDIVAMAATRDGDGYWLVAADGRVFRFGNAGRYGSASSGKPLANPIRAMAVMPDGEGYWLLPGLPVGPAAGFVAGHVTAIGDSVMLDAQPCLEADIPGIDVEAQVSRQWDAGIALAQQLRAEDKLGATVVIDLGTNGPVTPEMFAQMMHVLAGASRVVFVTVHLPPSYSWWQSVNRTLAQGVPKYAIDVLADFNKLADKHPQWFGPDGVHMPIGGAGAQAMAKLIASDI